MGRTKMAGIVRLIVIISSGSICLGRKQVTKAASSFTNCGCQCSSLTFVQNGRVQGNCRSSDETGAVWCYVDSAYSSTCQDKTPSRRGFTNPTYQNKAWSYEACATPFCGQTGGGYQTPVCKQGSRGCGGGNNGCCGQRCRGSTGFGEILAGIISGVIGGLTCPPGAVCGSTGNAGGSSGCRGSNCHVSSGGYENTECRGSSCHGGSSGSGGSGGSNCRGSQCEISSGGFGGSLSEILSGGIGGINCPSGATCGSTGNTGGSSQPFGGLFGTDLSGSQEIAGSIQPRGKGSISFKL